MNSINRTENASIFLIWRLFEINIKSVDNNKTAQYVLENILFIIIIFKRISLNKSKQNGDNNLKKIVITLLVGVKVVQWLYLAYSLYIDSTDFFFK